MADVERDGFTDLNIQAQNHCHLNENELSVDASVSSELHYLLYLKEMHNWG